MENQKRVESFCRNRTIYVYYLLDSKTGELLYIGRGFYPAQRKVVFERRTQMKVTLGVSQRFTDFGRACQAEKEAIKKHTPKFNLHLVSSPGNLGNSGKWHHSSESKAKIQAATLKQKHTPETKERLRQAALGNQHAKGKKRTPESIARVLATKRKLKEGKHYEV